MTCTRHKLISVKYLYQFIYHYCFLVLIANRLGRKPVMAIGIVMLVISMGTRPFMPNLTLVTILEFFIGAGSVIYYITPFLLREYYEMKYGEVMASVNYFCSKHERTPNGQGKRTIQRNWQHWVHKTQDENTQSKKHITLHKLC